MNLSYFLARRISSEQKDGFASTIHTIAIVTLTIGLAASIVAFLIMEGFQSTIKNRIYSFTANMLVQARSSSNSMEESPFFYNIDLYNHPEEYEGVRHVQEYSHKAGLIKVEDEVLGIAFKGVGRSFDTKSFSENIIEGKFITFSDSSYSRDVVLSKIIADKINAKVGDDLTIHFFQNPPRFRRLHVSGIYETNLSEYFDSKVIIGDIKLIQRLNNWADSVAGGLEVYLNDAREEDAVYVDLIDAVPIELYVEKVSDKFIQVFEWLGLVSRQVTILLVIIVVVVCVNMISVVLILVMERTQMVGLLKAMGARDSVVRGVFVYQGINLIMRGLLFGNMLGLGLCFLQDQFKIVKLSAHDYYMSYVPIGWDWPTVLLLNALIFVVVSVVLILPTAIISRINPIQAIRFD